MGFAGKICWTTSTGETDDGSGDGDKITLDLDGFRGDTADNSGDRSGDDNCFGETDKVVGDPGIAFAGEWGASAPMRGERTTIEDTRGDSDSLLARNGGAGIDRDVLKLKLLDISTYS